MPAPFRTDPVVTVPVAGGPRRSRPSAGSPLRVAEDAFRVLVADPTPLSLDGRLVGHGLPRRPMPLDELRAVLLHPATGRTARDTTWRLLVARARADGPAWVVGTVGVALPGLRQAAARLLRSTGNDDTEAELLAGFLTALATIEVKEPRVAGRLCNAAYIAARAALRRAEAARAGRVETVSGPAGPPVPWGHPDLVLAHAVRQGVLSVREAAVIGATRLEDITLSAYANKLGSTYEAVKRCRARGEARLLTALRDGRLDDPDADTIRDATLTYQPLHDHTNE